MSIYSSVKCQLIEETFLQLEIKFFFYVFIFHSIVKLQKWNGNGTSWSTWWPTNSVTTGTKKWTALTLCPGTCKIFTSSSLLPLNFMCTLFKSESHFLLFHNNYNPLSCSGWSHLKNKNKVNGTA